MSVTKGILYLIAVSIYIALNPKAESPLTKTTLFLGQTAFAAIANAGPIPMVPKVAASNQCFGKLFLRNVLPISIVFAP